MSALALGERDTPALPVGGTARPPGLVDERVSPRPASSVRGEASAPAATVGERRTPTAPVGVRRNGGVLPAAAPPPSRGERCGGDTAPRGEGGESTLSDTAPPATLVLGRRAGVAPAPPSGDRDGVPGVRPAIHRQNSARCGIVPKTLELAPNMAAMQVEQRERQRRLRFLRSAWATCVVWLGSRAVHVAVWAWTGRLCCGP
jgi:hypothetical protein